MANRMRCRAFWAQVIAPAPIEEEDNLYHARSPIPVDRLFCVLLRDVRIRIRARLADGTRQSHRAADLR
jgi:hypothetical protein